MTVFANATVCDVIVVRSLLQALLLLSLNIGTYHCSLATHYEMSHSCVHSAGEKRDEDIEIVVRVKMHRQKLTLFVDCKMTQFCQVNFCAGQICFNIGRAQTGSVTKSSSLSYTIAQL